MVVIYYVSRASTALNIKNVWISTHFSLILHHYSGSDSLPFALLDKLTSV